jgi:hypothetical protein
MFLPSLKQEVSCKILFPVAFGGFWWPPVAFNSKVGKQIRFSVKFW